MVTQVLKVQQVILELKVQMVHLVGLHSITHSIQAQVQEIQVQVE